MAMSQQTAEFLKFFGDYWYERNIADLGKDDPVSLIIEGMLLKPKDVLEIGCADGWRLRKLKEKYGCYVMGIDPSLKAIEAGAGAGLRLGLELQVGTADDICFPNNQFDLVIYGFCFSYIDPELYFKVLDEGDRVLKDGGYLIIHDRTAPFPIMRQHGHIQKATGEETCVYAYAMDFASLWLAHPFYTWKASVRDPDSFENVVVLQKNIESAFVRGSHVPEKTMVL